MATEPSELGRASCQAVQCAAALDRVSARSSYRSVQTSGILNVLDVHMVICIHWFASPKRHSFACPWIQASYQELYLYRGTAISGLNALVKLVRMDSDFQCSQGSSSARTSPTVTELLYHLQTWSRNVQGFKRAPISSGRPSA